MGLVDQIKNLIHLLESAKDDLQEWVDWAKEENVDVQLDVSIDLIADIEATLHDIGG